MIVTANSTNRCWRCGKVRQPQGRTLRTPRRILPRWGRPSAILTAGDLLQVDPDGKIKIKENGIVVAGSTDNCCCDSTGECYRQARKCGSGYYIPLWIRCVDETSGAFRAAGSSLCFYWDVKQTNPGPIADPAELTVMANCSNAACNTVQPNLRNCWYYGCPGSTSLAELQICNDISLVVSGFTGGSGFDVFNGSWGTFLGSKSFNIPGDCGTGVTDKAIVINWNCDGSIGVGFWQHTSCDGTFTGNSLICGTTIACSNNTFCSFTEHDNGLGTGTTFFCCSCPVSGDNAGITCAGDTVTVSIQ